jgi:hypothetical protein
MTKVPYSLSELRAVSVSDHVMDEYHRHLMQWAAARIALLEQTVMDLEDQLRDPNMRQWSPPASPV